MSPDVRAGAGLLAGLVELLLDRVHSRGEALRVSDGLSLELEACCVDAGSIWRELDLLLTAEGLFNEILGLPGRLRSPTPSGGRSP